jgi:ATP-dependent RNA/DNA helicase IGHMBP2
MMDQFIDNHLSLLSLEREEELSQGLSVLSTNLKDLRILEDKGICVSKLTVESERVGLFGRRVFTFRNSRQFGTTKLQTNLITSGDIVGVFVNGKSLTEQVTSGVITRSTENSIEVAFEELPEDINWSDCHGTLQLIKLANDVTYRRLKRALTDVKSHEHVSHHLIDVFFNDGPLAKPHPKWTNLLDKLDAEGIDSSDGFCFVNSSLDSSQKRAVLFALSRPSVAIIHGPPGTGKTTTVIEFILQSVQLKQKILACAPSNVAVDNLVDRLSSSGVNIIRLGHPARMVHSALKYSLDSLIAASDGSDIIMDVREEMNHALAKASKSSNSTERRKWRNEVKLLRKELIAREEKLLKELLCRADVILATNTGASSDGPLKNLPKDHFDVVVIDECAQSLEASCWIPIMKGSKCVLAGDHKQLPPTILSDKAAKGGLSVTLMERLVKLHGDSITTLLTVQYRMNRHIMRWPSEYLYDHLLTAHESVSNHLLKDMPGVAATCVTSCPLFFIDTAGCDISEIETTSDESRGNYGEADLVMYHAKDLLDAGVSPLDIAIIAPYNLQVDIIRKKLEDLSVKLDVHTVDSFQGQEKEAVIISFTRSNANGDIGFLKELRRTNVAVTRARRHLALIGDSQTISNEPFIKGLLDYCLHQGETHSAHEYIHYTVSTTTTISSTTCETGTTDVAITTTEVKENEINKITRQRLYYKEKLEHLLESNEEIMSTFPCALTSQERKIIHEVCNGIVKNICYYDVAV